MSKQPFSTDNPQNFKLRIVWSVDGSTKLVAEFSSCKWLPRIGETLVLPIDETRRSSSWRKFKVFDIIYDFHAETTRVLCSPIKSPTSPDVKSLISKIQEPKDWDIWEKAFEASEATMRANELRGTLVTPEFTKLDTVEPVDEELRKLRDLLDDL
jgi:hypothetical protein